MHDLARLLLSLLLVPLILVVFTSRLFSPNDDKSLFVVAVLGCTDLALQQQRVTAAIDVALRRVDIDVEHKPNERVVLVFVGSRNEALLFARQVSERTVDLDVLVDDRSRQTHDNAIYLLERIEELCGGTCRSIAIELVTSDFHVARSALLLHRAIRGASVSIENLTYRAVRADFSRTARAPGCWFANELVKFERETAGCRHCREHGWPHDAHSDDVAGVPVASLRQLLPKANLSDLVCEQ